MSRTLNDSNKFKSYEFGGIGQREEPVPGPCLLNFSLSYQKKRGKLRFLVDEFFMPFLAGIEEDHFEEPGVVILNAIHRIAHTFQGAFPADV